MFKWMLKSSGHSISTCQGGFPHTTSNFPYNNQVLLKTRQRPKMELLMLSPTSPNQNNLVSALPVIES